MKIAVNGFRNKIFRMFYFWGEFLQFSPTKYFSSVFGLSLKFNLNISSESVMAINIFEVEKIHMQRWKKNPVIYSSFYCFRSGFIGTKDK